MAKNKPLWLLMDLGSGTVCHPESSRKEEAPVHSLTLPGFWPVLSVFVNPKDPDAVQLGQLGNQHSEQGNGVDHEMDAVVFGVEAGENVPERRRRGRQAETSRDNPSTIATRPESATPGEKQPINNVEFTLPPSGT